MAALSQLSYSPKSDDHLIEVVLVGHLDQCLLVVARRRETQMHDGQAGDLFDRQVEAPVEGQAMDRDRVHLVGGVGRPQVAARRVTARSDADDNHVACESAPLALDPVDGVIDVEDQVVPPTFLQGHRYEDAQWTAAAVIAVSAIAPFSLGFNI